MSTDQHEGEPAAVLAARARTLRAIDAVLENPQAGLVVALLIFGAVITSKSDTFLTQASMIEILRSSVYVFIIGVAATFVFVAGGLDLSVGSTLALGGVVAGKLLVDGQSIPIAIAGALGVGALVGLINGVIIVYLEIPPLITTLGVLYIGQGSVVVITNGEPILPFPDGFNAIAQDQLWGIPLLVYYGLVVGVFGHVILAYTKFGYHVRATGGNRTAAEAMGLHVRRISVLVYVASGIAAALSGVLLASQLGSAQSSVGSSTMLQVIAAVIIGGTSLFGGVGTITGTLLGALLLSTISNGLNAVALNPAYQNIVVGVVIILAVGIDGLRRARMFKKSART